MTLSRRSTTCLLSASFAFCLSACEVAKKQDGTAQEAAAQASSSPQSTTVDPALKALQEAARSDRQKEPGTTPPPPANATTSAPTKVNPPATGAPTAVARPANESEACDEAYQAFRSVYDALPSKFFNADPNLGSRVDAASRQCREYMSRCTAVPVRAAEARAVLAKFLYTMSAVRKAEWQAALSQQYQGRELSTKIIAMNKSYMSEIVALTDAAASALPKEHPLRGPTLMVSGQAASQARAFDQAAKAYQTFIDDYDAEKDIEERARAVAGLASALRESGQYLLGIALVEGSLEELKGTKTYPYLLDGLYKLHLGRGDLAAMLKSSEDVLAKLPAVAKNGKFTRRERESIQSVVIYHGFRKAYAQFAMGRVEEARQTFREHIALLDAREKTLAAAGGALPPAWKIYRDRSRANLAFLDERAGRPAPHDLDLDSGWVTKGAPLSELRGRVTAVLFRRVGDDRSAPFLEDLHQICANNPRLEMRTIAYLRSEHTIAKEFDEMRDELQQLGYEGPAGFDPDFSNKTIFRAFQAMVGSATFLVVDAEGNLVWFQQDPRRQDVNFAKSILERVASGA